MRLKPFLVLVIVVSLAAIASCSAPLTTSTAASSKSGHDRDGTAIEAAAVADGRDGSTFEKAIVVNSVKEEYKWLALKYPEYTVKSQALVRKERPYDVLTFITKEGETKVAHFDISRFFGKGF